MAKPDNFPEKQHSFSNPGALDIKELPHFSLLLDAFRRTYFAPLCYNQWWSVTLISLFVMFVTMIYGLFILKSCRQAALCQHACETPAPSVTRTNICFTNRGTALSIYNPLSLAAVIVAYTLKKYNLLRIKINNNRSFVRLLFSKTQ